MLWGGIDTLEGIASEIPLAKVTVYVEPVDRASFEIPLASVRFLWLV